ncbi:hypothetical protein ABTZ58_35470 [Streptomyces sp. NPDC094143]|uniref:hypothetical protein n=1 Tax=Streptomyces sp. NPDC094143 TaxID=3155310 RepID=UPI003331FDDA
MKSSLPVLKGTAALLAALGVVVGVGGPSGAQPLEVPAGHCVYYEATKVTTCQSTLAQSIQAADSGAGLAVAVLYGWVNYNSTGPTMVISVSRGDCSLTTGTPDNPQKDYRFPTMPPNWNDAVASVSTELPNGSHCDVWFSSNAGFEGECGDNQWIHKNPNLMHMTYPCYQRASSFELS